MRRFASALLVLAAPALAAADSEREAADGARQLATAIRAHDARAIAKRLRAPVTNTGMWFADASCTKRFAAPGSIPAKDVDAFARCLAQVKLQLSTRKSGLREGAILTYDPGIEIELVFDGSLVRWIGFETQVASNGVPTLTAQAFEELRKTGSTLLDDVVRPKLEIPGRSLPDGVWFKICLDASGAVTSATAATNTPAASTIAANAFADAIKDWTFRPFQVRGTAMPVCSMTLLSFPAAKAPAVESLPTANVPMARISHLDDDEWGEEGGVEGGIAIGWVGAPPPPPPPPPPAPPPTVPPRMLETLRVAGNKDIVPDLATKQKMLAAGRDKVVASMKMCLDDKGGVLSVTQLKSSGFADYDQKIQSEMRQWLYKPYKVNGKSVAACTAVTFIFDATK